MNQIKETQKDMLQASPELAKKGGLFYTEDYPDENLYYLLYYNFIDGNDMHFGNRAISLPVDHQKVLEDCVSVIKRICELDGICEKQFFEKYGFPDSVASSVQKVKNMIFHPAKKTTRNTFKIEKD